MKKKEKEESQRELGEKKRGTYFISRLIGLQWVDSDVPRKNVLDDFHPKEHDHPGVGLCAKRLERLHCGVQLQEVLQGQLGEINKMIGLSDSWKCCSVIWWIFFVNEEILIFTFHTKISIILLGLQSML